MAQYTPSIAVTCDFETIKDSRGYPSPRYVCPQNYVASIRDAGGRALLIPHESVDLTQPHLDFDALVIAGGDFDIPPSYYGEQPRRGLGALLEDRSAAERALCETAIAAQLPMLAVCGGMQLLNVLRRGTLYQDLSERDGTAVHEQPHDKRTPAHNVELAQGSLLARIFETQTISVNSTHHQVIRNLGDGLLASAIAPDGVIEAIELTDHPFALGVQWHPEALLSGDHLPLYRALVQAASRH